MRRSQLLTASFQAAQPDLQNYIVALEKENLKLHKQVTKFQVQDTSKQNRIKALEKELKAESKKHGLVLNITYSGENPRKD